MANFIGTDIINIFIDTMDKLRADIGREVLVILPPTEISCPNCSYDSVKKKSTNRYDPDVPYPSGAIGPNSIVGSVDFNSIGILICPVCNGLGTITSAAQEFSVNCLISVLKPEEAEKTILGKDYKYNYELSASIDDMEVFLNCKKAIVDGHPCSILSAVPDGIGTLSQVTILAGGK